MRQNGMRQNFCAVMAAFIWGTAFVAQSMGAEHVDAFTYSTSRFFVGFLALLAICVFLRKTRKEEAAKRSGPAYWKTLLIGGFWCGLAMAAGSNLQQKGIETTSPGKAGFITALYIVIVPIIGIFLRRRASWTVWFSVALAVVGLYFLCIQEDVLSIAEGDFLIILCAFCFAGQILLIDHFAMQVDGIELSCAQLFFVMLFSAVGMVFYGESSWQDIQMAAGSILYVGIFSSAGAYTLQILAQKDSNPTVISLLLSLESVFATLSGAVILHTQMTGREYLGCVLMLAAVILAQIPVPSLKKRPLKNA